MIRERAAENLIWIDLEFTNLEPTTSFIMQAAMIITSPQLEPLPPRGVEPKVGGLLYDIHIDEQQASTASEWVRQNQAQQLERSKSPDAFPLEKVEAYFVDYLLSCCEVPEDKRSRPLLAGNSVHGDHRFLWVHMPRLAELLSFRNLDVSSFKEAARRWCPEREFRKTEENITRWFPGEVVLEGEAHDALYDIKASIAELAFYRERLFVPEARAKPAQ